MPLITLVISGLSAILFALLGFLLGRRSMVDEMRPAWNLFRTWWFSIAAITTIDPLLVALHVADALPVWLYLPVQQVERIAIAVALWALLCYLIYAYRGTRHGWGPLAVAYAGIAFFLLVLLAYAGEPTRFVLEQGEVEAQPDTSLTPSVTGAVLLVLVGPQIVAAIAYARLYFRVQHATQRFRVGLVSAAIIGWFGIRLAGAFAAAQGPAWEVVAASLGLVAAILVLVAYFPPPMIQQRYGVRSLANEATA